MFYCHLIAFLVGSIFRNLLHLTAGSFEVVLDFFFKTDLSSTNSVSFIRMYGNDSNAYKLQVFKDRYVLWDLKENVRLNDGEWHSGECVWFANYI